LPTIKAVSWPPPEMAMMVNGKKFNSNNSGEYVLPSLLLPWISHLFTMAFWGLHTFLQLGRFVDIKINCICFINCIEFI